MSDTLFLQPIYPISNPHPNYASATGGEVFSNYSQAASTTLTTTDADTLVKGGVAAALADAQAVFSNDANFSAVFTNSAVVGVGGASQGSSSSQAKVVASFSVGKNQTFSFDFKAGLYLDAKEIENTDAEYNQAKGKTSFLVLDTSNVNKPKVLDYFGINGKLISSEQIGNLKWASSRNVTITDRNKNIELNGNNGIDYLRGEAIGNYQRQFNRNTNITIVELNTSDTKFMQDNLIGKLGSDVTYGTIWDDNLKGSNTADKIYGSLGDDKVDGQGGNDILEGGSGNDKLNGGAGHDKVYGGDGNDTLIGGAGNDTLVGGSGNDVMWGNQGKDLFLFQNGDSLFPGELDIIKDFQVDKDKIELQGWGAINASDLLGGSVAGLQISDSNNGTLLSSSSSGQILLEGVTVNQLNPNNFLLA